MRAKNASLDLKLKRIDETRNYLLEEMRHDYLISKSVERFVKL